MDLSNALALDTTWDPDTLHSPLQHLIPRTLSEPYTVPFAEALPTSVMIPQSDRNYKKADIFIDDLIYVILDNGAGCKRGAASSLFGHPHGRETRGEPGASPNLISFRTPTNHLHMCSALTQPSRALGDFVASVVRHGASSCHQLQGRVSQRNFPKSLRIPR
jgi:hypothetical protein